jgi:hypothetical protein
MGILEKGLKARLHKKAGDGGPYRMGRAFSPFCPDTHTTQPCASLRAGLVWERAFGPHLASAKFHDEPYI